MKIWRATVERFFGWTDSVIDQKRIRESFSHPVIKQSGPERIRYYENGRSTAITCHFGPSRGDIDLIIHKNAPLRWQDTGALLTPEESEQVFQKVGEHLDERKVRWKFSDASSGN